MVKLVNTLHSGCSELKLLEVRVFSWAQAIRLIKLDFFYTYTMRVAFLHTTHAKYKINNLIDDISSNVKTDDFTSFVFPYLWIPKKKITNLFKLRKFLKKNKIDIIHVYDYIDAYFVMKVIKDLNIRVVFSDYEYHDELKGLKKRFYKKVLDKADHIISPTEYYKKYLVNNCNLNANKCSKLFHGFSFKRFDNYEYKSVRDEFFIDDLRYLIGTIGDFTPEHDMMGIFRMIKKLRRTGRNFTCIVAGDQVDEYDTYYNSCKYYYLMQGLDNYITYIGRREDDANLLSQLDLFVYCSGKEPAALSVIEAMVQGINVVANDCEMIREMTFNGKYASLYEGNNDLDFAKKTRDVLLNLEDYKLISQVVKEETRQIYSIERHIIELKNIYSIILNSNDK